MAKQDDFVRITLRLPKELHAQLEREAGPRSLNSEIVTRLSKTLAPQVATAHEERLMDNERRLMMLVADLRKSMNALEHQSQQLFKIAESERIRRSELEEHIKLLASKIS